MCVRCKSWGSADPPPLDAHTHEMCKECVRVLTNLQPGSEAASNWDHQADEGEWHGGTGAVCSGHAAGRGWSAAAMNEAAAEGG